MDKLSVNEPVCCQNTAAKRTWVKPELELVSKNDVKGGNWPSIGESQTRNGPGHGPSFYGNQS